MLWLGRGARFVDVRVFLSLFYSSPAASASAEMYSLCAAISFVVHRKPMACLRVFVCSPKGSYSCSLCSQEPRKLAEKNSSIGAFHKRVVPSSKTKVGPFPEMQIARASETAPRIFLQASANAKIHFWENFCSIEIKTSEFSEEISSEIFIVANSSRQKSKTFPSAQTTAAFSALVPMSTARTQLLDPLGNSSFRTSLFIVLVYARVLPYELFDDVAVVEQIAERLIMMNARDDVRKKSRNVRVDVPFFVF